MTHNLQIESAYPVEGTQIEKVVAVSASESKQVVTENSSAIISQSTMLVENQSITTQLVSSFHARFRGLVDYIFYDKKRIQLLGYLTLPTLQDVEEGRVGKGLPSKVYPSDHFPLKALFALTTEE